MSYKINTFDVCVQGFERMRSQDEFILVASITPDTTEEELRQQWLDDIQAIVRDDDFDYDAANACVNDYVDKVVRPLFNRRNNPFDLESMRLDMGIETEMEGITAFLFMEKLE